MATAMEYKVQLDDLDYMNHVGHAHWLLILEKSRVNLMEQIGFPLEKLLERKLAVVVAEITIRYLRPGKLGQVLTITNQPTALAPAVVQLETKVVGPDQKEMVSATLRLVCVNERGKSTPIPEDLKAKLFA